MIHSIYKDFVLTLQLLTSYIYQLPPPFKRSQRFLLLMKTSFKNILWKHFIFLTATIWKHPDFLNALISDFHLLAPLDQIDTCLVQSDQDCLPGQDRLRGIAAMRYEMPAEREGFSWKSSLHGSCTFDAEWNNAGYSEYSTVLPC